MKTLFSAITLLSVFLLLASCAYSPQQITINPVIGTDAEVYGNGRAIEILVEDGRVNKALGSRGGVYKETSVITLANDLTEAVTRAAKAKLAVQGFNVNSSAGSNAAQFKIIIEQLNYDIPEQSPGKKVVLSAQLKVEVVAAGETYAGSYKTNTEQQTVFTPSMARNEKMINTLLSNTLLRLFSDPKLKAFLSNI